MKLPQGSGFFLVLLAILLLLLGCPPEATSQSVTESQSLDSVQELSQSLAPTIDPLGEYGGTITVRQEEGINYLFLSETLLFSEFRTGISGAEAHIQCKYGEKYLPSEFNILSEQDCAGLTTPEGVWVQLIRTDHNDFHLVAGEGELLVLEGGRWIETTVAIQDVEFIVEFWRAKIRLKSTEAGTQPYLTLSKPW